MSTLIVEIYPQCTAVNESETLSEKDRLPRGPFQKRGSTNSESLTLITYPKMDNSEFPVPEQLI